MRKWISFFWTAVVLGSMLTVAFADETPDMSRMGSVEVSVGINGGELTIYRVGMFCEEDGNYHFIPVGDFADCRLPLNDIGSADLAAELAQYAAEHELAGVTKEILGSAVFDGLEPGLYLLVQEEAAGGYQRLSPFLVSIPGVENGEYIYDVDATPKIGSISPTEPTSPKPSGPREPTLPQTGQRNWPVAVLTVLGLALSAAGWGMRKQGK